MVNTLHLGKEHYTDESYVYTTTSGLKVLLYETDFYDASKSDDVLNSFISHNKYDKAEDGDFWVEYEYGDITYGTVGSYDFVYQDCEKTYWDGRVEQTSRYAAFVGDHHFIDISFSTFETNDETVKEYIDALNSITLV